MRSNYEISSLELRQAERSPSTGADYEMISTTIVFPDNVRGKVIIDIGSGVSPVTLRLRRQGAAAFGIDIRYRNLAELKSSADQYIKNHLQSADADTSETAPRHHEFLKRVSKSRDVFFNRVKAGDKPYIAAQSSFLPIASNTVDFAFSDQCLSIGVIHDRAVFLLAVTDTIRTLKQGGELQMHPWFDSAQRGRWSLEMFETASLLLDTLKNANTPFSIINTSRPDFLTLAIKKS